MASEIASVGLNREHKKSCVLFGDGAAAVVVQKGDAEGPSRILATKRSGSKLVFVTVMKRDSEMKSPASRFPPSPARSAQKATPRRRWMSRSWRFAVSSLLPQAPK